MSNIKFDVNSEAIKSYLIDRTIRMHMKSKKNPEYKKLYKQSGLMGTALDKRILSFIKKHPEVFNNIKLVNSKGSVFEDFITISPLFESENYIELLKNRMAIGYDLNDQEINGMKAFFEDFEKLSNAPEIKEVVKETKRYKSLIERDWQATEPQIKRYVEDVIGSRVENEGMVQIFIMPRMFDIHKTCPITGKKTFAFYGNQQGISREKCIAHLAHQAIHQPVFPYTQSMLGEDREEFHAFIKFMSDKEVYHRITGASYLDIDTPKENAKVMANVYPYWLGYLHRNDAQKGKNPAEEIKKDISRDKLAFDKLSSNSKKRKLYSLYNFEKLDSERIAKFFQDKRGMSPYDVSRNINFRDKNNIYKLEYLIAKNRYVSNSR